MPKPSLSLFGFMDEPQALAYLQKWAILPEQDRAPDGMRRIWREAKMKLGKPFAKPGKPEIQPLQPRYHPYLDEVTKNPLFDLTIRGFERWGVMLVEINPLLTFQFHISTDETDKFSAMISRNPTVEEMLTVCLPRDITYPDYEAILTANGVTIRAQNLGLGHLEHGWFQKFPDGRLLIAGVAFGASPLLQVVRINGRCFLRNGFHRAYALAKKGATHIPCLFLETNNFGLVGAVGAGATFDIGQLIAPVPPTAGYLTQDRAYPLSLKHFKRIINVLWNQYEVEVDEETMPLPDNPVEP